MNRVNWVGVPLQDNPPPLPTNLRETVFDYLPPPIPWTPVMDELADKYLQGQFAGGDYLAMQAAAFLRPKSQESHQQRRHMFRQRVKEAEADGFRIPDVFHVLVETDEFIDRLHHNCIWLEMPEELWRLPSDPSQLVFLAFTEGQGCGNWHLLLAPDGSHCMVCCEHPFGLPSNWPVRVPDYSNWEVERCADSVEEWLYHYFLQSAEHDQRYLAHLQPCPAD